MSTLAFLAAIPAVLTKNKNADSERQPENLSDPQNYYKLARKRVPVVDRIGQVLLDAITYIDGHGWCQGNYRNDWGHVCMIGAINRSNNNPILRLRAKHRLRRYLKLTVGSRSIVNFNDSAGRCLSQVEAALTEAAYNK